MRSLSIQHLNEIMDWLKAQSHIEVLYVNYNRMLEDPAGPIAAIHRFLGRELDLAQMAAMMDQSLYRNRR
jgi:hypothetical protein